MVRPVSALEPISCHKAASLTHLSRRTARAAARVAEEVRVAAKETAAAATEAEVKAVVATETVEEVAEKAAEKAAARSRRKAPLRSRDTQSQSSWFGREFRCLRRCRRLDSVTNTERLATGRRTADLEARV